MSIFGLNHHIHCSAIWPEQSLESSVTNAATNSTLNCGQLFLVNSALSTRSLEPKRLPLKVLLAILE
jgi:hypothetical protein